MLGKWFVTHAARLIATSAQEREELLAGHIESERIVIRPNGIDVAAFGRLPPRGRLRQQYGVAAQDKLLLFLSRLSVKKGLNLLLPALAQTESARRSSAGGRPGK